MFFAEPGKYKPCGIFSVDHFILILITLLSICVALSKTIHKNKDEVKDIITKCTIIVWILEAVIITFKLKYNSLKDVNTYVPLYYCSLLLYAGAFSSFAKGKLKRIGDVFLASGAVIGGVVFILFPTTSLPTYPAFHLVSIHSFLFHGIMVYLGLLINITNYITLEKKDIIYYAGLVGIVCALAYIVNKIFGSNLMFISKDFPETPIHIIYKFTGKFFTIVMSVRTNDNTIYSSIFTKKTKNKKKSRG